MNQNLLGAAYNLLKHHTPEEIDELVKVLQRFNKCDPKQRADCLKYGCKNDTQPNQQDITESIERYMAKAAQDIYMGPTANVCSCCNRPL